MSGCGCFDSDRGRGFGSISRLEGAGQAWNCSRWHNPHGWAVCGRRRIDGSDECPFSFPWPNSTIFRPIECVRAVLMIREVNMPTFQLLPRPSHATPQQSHEEPLVVSQRATPLHLRTRDVTKLCSQPNSLPDRSAPALQTATRARTRPFPLWRLRAPAGLGTAPGRMVNKPFFFKVGAGARARLGAS